MIARLRRKLIVAAMASLIGVLTVMIAGVSLFNYHSIVQQADSTLELLKANGGTFPTVGDGHNKDGPHFSPELPYESRYFTVTLAETGSVLVTNTGKIAAIDSETANAYAKLVLQSGETQGFYESYRYIVYTEDSQSVVIFLDCRRDLSQFQRNLITMIQISVIGSLFVLILMIFLSARIMRPFIENEEKQKRFITDAGHELKTPLTIIDADSQVLEMDIGENEWLQDIGVQTKRLASLTNQLIYLAKMEEGQGQDDWIDFPLSDVISETVDSFQAIAKTTNKTLESSIEPMITMCGDEKAIQRLITIFLDNAMKYTPENGDISVKLSQSKNQIQLVVYNTCDSISRENISHLFDRFYRTDQSRNSSTGGYGLGLSIASAIVQRHKGKIRANTEDEQSLNITVTFPK